MTAMKVVEFIRLTQGTRTMKEYLHAFNNLSRYAPEFVNTDAKKIASFKRGSTPRCWKQWVLLAERCSMISSVIVWPKKTTTTHTLHPRTARELLSQVLHKQELLWQVILRIVHQHLVQGSDHLRRGTRITSHSRGTRSLSRWQHHRKR